MNDDCFTVYYKSTWYRKWHTWPHTGAQELARIFAQNLRQAGYKAYVIKLKTDQNTKAASYYA